MGFDLDLQRMMMKVLALLIAIPVHEFAHALSAVNNGDDGPRRDGRLSIMPWDHFDPLGAFFCFMSSVFGIGIGWGRPVMVNPGLLNDPRWSMCKIAVWGPFSNLLLAIGFAIPLRMGWIPLDDGGLKDIFLVFIQVNLGLMFFNLIPVGPLDGAKVVAAFLPDPQADSFSRFQSQWGMPMLFALLFVGGRVGLLGLLIGEPMTRVMLLLLGPNWAVV
jgi:Zn-dependent protease